MDKDVGRNRSGEITSPLLYVEWVAIGRYHEG